MNKLKSHVYEQMRLASREYSKKVHGNGVSESTLAGQKLQNEQVLKIEPPEQKLDIEDPTEVNKLDMELLKTALQTYEQELEKSVRILQENGQDGIAYEVRQIQRRVQDTVREINDEHSRK